MKGKRIIWGIVIAVMLLVTVALAVAATDVPVEEYTGTVSGAEQQLGTVDSKKTVREKISVLDKLLLYIETIDPEEEGYAEFLAEFEAKELEVAKLIYAEAIAKTTPAEKEASLLILKSFLTSHEVTDTAEDGLYLYFLVDGVKTYVNIVKDQDAVTAVLSTEAATLYQLDEVTGALVATVDGVEYTFVAVIDGETKTLGFAELTADAILGKFYSEVPAVAPVTEGDEAEGEENEPETPLEPEAPATEMVVVSSPLVGTAYKLGFASTDAVYYLALDGTLNLTDDTAASIDVYLDEVNNNLFTLVEILKTEIAEEYLIAAGQDSLTADEMHALLDALNAYVATYAPALRSDFALDLEEVNYNCATEYYSLLAGLDKTYDRGALLRRLTLFTIEHPFDTVEASETFLNVLLADKAAYLADMLEAKAELHKLNQFIDLEKPPLSNHDFTPSDDVTNPNNKTGMLLADGNLDAKKQPISFIDKDFGRDGENGYFTVRYDVSGIQMGAKINMANITQSAVFEFDITTLGTLPNAMISVQSAGNLSANGKSWSAVFFSITSDGDIVEGTDKTKVLVDNAITKGEWTHVSIVFNFDTNDVDVYVDYALVLEKNFAHTSGYIGTLPGFGFYSKPTEVGGEFNLDNVQVYQGLAPRDLGFADLSAEEKFVFYVNEIDNNDLSFYARKNYYDTASRLLENYYNGDTFLTNDQTVINAVYKLVEFGTAVDENTPSPYQVLLNNLSEYNLNQIKTAVKKVTDMPRLESNTSDRTYFLGLADNVIASSGSYILDSEALGAYINSLNVVRNNLAEEESLSFFVAAINDFYAAASIEKMKEAYNKAVALYKSVDGSLATAAFPNFRDAYAKYEEMELILNDKIIIENSKRLLACIAYVGSFPESEWEANYDFLLPYVLMAREIIEAGTYDPFYKNGDEAVIEFQPMSDYFYSRMQEKFVEHIEGELDRANKSDKYFEKLGICIKLDEYIIDNELEGGSEKLEALILEVRTLLDTLIAERGEYEDLLKENTEIFVEICKDLVGSIDYATMKTICSNASQYYYMMDVSDASAQDAIGIYVARCNEIDAVEAYAEEFIMEVNLLTKSGADILAGIVSASTYLEKVERDVAGVSGAIKTLETVCSVYDKRVEGANRELSNTFAYAMYTTNTNKIAASAITLAFNMVK